MVRRTKEEAQETRHQILDAAEQVFRGKGVCHATLADIAAAAGVTRGAIYWHFASKAGLLRAVNDRAHLPLEAIHRAIADARLDDPLAALRAGTSTVIGQITEDERLQGVFEVLLFKCEYVDEMAEMLVRRRENRDDCLRAIAENLRHAVDRGQLPALLDIDQATLGLYAMLDGLFANWLMEHGSFDLASTADAAVQVYLTGLGTEQAAKPPR